VKTENPCACATVNWKLCKITIALCCQSKARLYKSPHHVTIYIQNVPGGKVNTLGGQSIGHLKQKVYMYLCLIPNGF
jgi:hypothetical protein